MTWHRSLRLSYTHLTRTWRLHPVARLLDLPPPAPSAHARLTALAEPISSNAFLRMIGLEIP
jgi:hypothetical protein